MCIKKTDGGNIKIILKPEEFNELAIAQNGVFNAEQKAILEKYLGSCSKSIGLRPTVISDDTHRVCRTCVYGDINPASVEKSLVCKRKIPYEAVSSDGSCVHHGFLTVLKKTHSKA